MKKYTYFEDPIKFQKALKTLQARRKNSDKKSTRKYSLTKAQKEEILNKTDSRCHICGCNLKNKKFECDHVKSHSSGGSSIINNFLPACSLCNNYRWHYLSKEFQWILKLGVWARTEVAHGSKLGNEIGRKFISKEKSREKKKTKIN
jgi:hypothetical protein